MTQENRRTAEKKAAKPEAATIYPFKLATPWTWQMQAAIGRVGVDGG